MFLNAHLLFVILSSSSQRSPSPGPNHTSSSSASNSTPAPQNTSVRPTCSLTPTLAAHFNENLIKHVQGWPADHAEKQVSAPLLCYLGEGIICSLKFGLLFLGIKSIRTLILVLSQERGKGD